MTINDLLYELKPKFVWPIKLSGNYGARAAKSLQQLQQQKKQHIHTLT